MESIKQILMRRDGMSAEDADELIQQAKDKVAERIESEDFGPFLDIDSEICSDYFGLEPEYFMELMP